VDELNEPAEQVAFADLVLLNKTDLVDEAALERIERRIRAINGTAKIHRTKNADVAIDKVLNVGAFDLQRALAGRWFLPRARVSIRVGRCVPAHARRLSAQDGRLARSSCARARSQS
jgi:G3E family GTPase